MSTIPSDLSRYKNTEVYTRNGAIRVALYGTEIFSMSATGDWRGQRLVVLAAGGHHTATTKRRINEALDAYGVHASVYQRKGEWFVSVDSGRRIARFHDGIRIIRRVPADGTDPGRADLTLAS